MSASFASGVAGSRLVVDGDVTLRQRLALPRAAGGVYKPYLLSPLPALGAATSADAASPAGILAAIAARNYSLAFTPSVAPVWVPDAAVPAAFDAAATLGTVPRSFTLELVARMPLAPVLLRPSIANELKHGWIQYVAILSITLVAAALVRRALFGLVIVETTVLADAPRSLAKYHVA